MIEREGEGSQVTLRLGGGGVGWRDLQCAH